MNKILLCLFFILSAVSCKQWYHYVKAIELDEKSFREHTESSKYTVVDFFTPWCGYCQQMAGEYNQLYIHYHENEESRKDVSITKINCDDHPHFCASIGVQSFPAIKLYSGGRLLQVFNRMRRFNDFREWIESSIPAYVPPEKTAEQKQQEENARQQEQIAKQQEQEQKAKEQQQREQEQKRKEQEEQLRLKEESIERQHREELQLLEREQQQRKQRENEEKKQKQQREEEEKQRNKQAQAQQERVLSSDQNNNKESDSVAQQILNKVSQQAKIIETSTSIIPDVYSTVQGLKSNLDFTIQKIGLVDEHQKNLKESISGILTEVHKLQEQIREFNQKEKEAKPQQIHITNPSNQPAPQTSSFNIANCIMFISVGICLGYIFSNLFGGKKSASSLLVTHNDVKSN